MDDQIRLFLALDLPAEVLDSLEAAQRELKRTGADVRWVRPESIHLTLKFLGSVEAGRVPDIAAAVRPPAAACRPMSLRPAGTGVFPRPSNPRVVWVGLGGDLEAVTGLASDLDQALTAVGFAPEERPFSPHLTLGRVKSGRNKAGLVDGLLSLRGYQGPVFEAGELILFRSELKPSGAVYTALEKFPFLGGSAER